MRKPVFWGLQPGKTQTSLLSSSNDQLKSLEILDLTI